MRTDKHLKFFERQGLREVRVEAGLAGALFVGFQAIAGVRHDQCAAAVLRFA